MKPVVLFRKDADRDVAEAASWYERQRAGLGHEFLDEALTACHAIAEQPLVYPVVHRNTRRKLMSRFPFAVYFRVEEDRIVVLAVIHGSRDPRRWKTRTE